MQQQPDRVDINYNLVEPEHDTIPPDVRHQPYASSILHAWVQRTLARTGGTTPA